MSYYEEEDDYYYGEDEDFEYESPDLQKHKKSDTVKWILTLIAFILVGIALAGIICGWFVKKDETVSEPTEQASVFDENGNELADGEVHAMPTSMTFAAAAAAETTSVTVEATVLPAEASNKKVDWTVKWANEGAEWATGKQVNDYVTVAPTADGSTTATVTNKAAFGEQIVITVTSRDNPDATAECTVDYLQRIESVTMKIGNVTVNLGGDTNITLLIGKDTGGAGGVISLEKTLSTVYTVAETYADTISLTGGDKTGGAEGGYVSHVQGRSMGAYRGISYDNVSNAVGRTMYFDRRLFTEYNFLYLYNTMNSSMQTTSHQEPMVEQSFYNIQEQFQYVAGNILWDVAVTVTGTHKTYSYSSVLRMSQIDSTVPVSSVQIGTPDVKF